MKVITLLTDFGDFYPGVMKGVILKINPNAKVVDISHSVEPQNVMQAAFLLANYHIFFENAVHVIVVDPGVGGSREALVVEAGDVFIAPNNGILTPILDKKTRVWKIDESKASKYTGVLSTTFHGRDVFAPTAALVTLNRFEEVVQPFDGKIVKLDLFNPKIIGNTVECNAVYIDRFGNIVTDLKKDVVERLEAKGFYIGDVYFPLVDKYEDVKLNEPLCVVGSFNTLEFSVRNGNASKKFRISSGKLKLEVCYE